MECSFGCWVESPLQEKPELDQLQIKQRVKNDRKGLGKCYH